MMITKDANTPRQEAELKPQTANPEQIAELKKRIQEVREKAKKTGSYVAALLAIGNIVPVFAAFLSVLLYITLFTLSPSLKPPWLNLSATVGGSLFVLLCWLLIAGLYKRFTAVDRANSASYEQLLNRLQQTVAWYEILTKNPAPKGNSLYAIGMQEISDSFSKICEGLQVQGPSWISATGYTSAWKLMHRIDEAFVETEPVEAVIHNALHDEMSLQDSTLTNRDDLLNKLRIAVKMLAQEATLYLNQQPPQVPQDGQTKLPDLHAKPSAMQNTVNVIFRSLHLKACPHAKPSAMQNTVNPAENNEAFSNTIDPVTQARTIICEVRSTLHHFRDDRWDKLIRVRNQLMKMTLVTGLLLYALVEFAIIMIANKPNEVDMLEAATIFYFVGGLVGLFSRLYNQSKTDTSIDDFRLATARLIAAPLYSGLAAIGGVLVVQLVQKNLALTLSATNILIAAAFGLTPSLLTSAIQKEADQYKTDLKSTAATAPTKEKQKYALSNNDSRVAK